MCGILGVLGRPVEPDRLARMADQMAQRGPDAAGYIHWGQGALAHRRLSILDTSAAANQPFVDPASGAVLVYNGEVYNFHELRRRLEGLGHVFRTTGDTEVVLAAYLEWGETCPRELNGMFAFAVWDPRRQRLFLARDRFGKKPLFIARLADGSLLFASELKPLIASGWIDTALDPQAVLDYLEINYVLSPRTMLRQVRQLPAGHTASWQWGQWTESSYWDLAEYFQAERWTEPAPQLAERLHELLLDATRRRLYSDVPLGGFLSGGVDSSTITALMRQSGVEQLHTFSVEFASPAFNEGAYARLAASHLGTRHHPRQIDESRLADLLPEFAWRMDVPLGDDSAIATYLLSRWTREHVTVALSGDGADELFAGYVTYQADRLHRTLGRLRRPAAWLIERLAAVLPEGGAKLSRRYRAEQFARGLRADAAGAHFAWRQVAAAPELHAAAGGYRPADAFRAHYERVPDADWLDRLLYVDCATWLRDDILVKVDRASMAASLECRAPFLDYRVAEFAARLPRACKLNGGQKKVLLRRLARQQLPAAIVDRRKAGFNAPTADWLRGPLRALAEELFTGGRLDELGLAWQPALAGRWQALLRGDRRHQYALWGLFCLALWQREVLHGARAGTTEVAQRRAV